jgi:hypothetical protein
MPSAYLNAGVPRRLGDLTHSENAAAAVRVCLAINATRRIQTGGIVIVLGANAQRTLPDAAPALELERMTDGVADG